MPVMQNSYIPTVNSLVLCHNKGDFWAQSNHEIALIVSFNMDCYYKFGNYLEYLIFPSSVKEIFVMLKFRDKGMIYLYQ